MTRNLVVCAALAWAWLGYIATAGMAQDPILAQLYGSGVHEYFSGGYRQAIADLTQAIDGGTKDPRVYYFRALSWWRLGDNVAGPNRSGGGRKMESADVNQYYPVSKSLERVQGTGRLLLERYRVQARAEAYRREERRNLARYEAQRKAEAEVLRAAPVATGSAGRGSCRDAGCHASRQTACRRAQGARARPTTRLPTIPIRRRLRETMSDKDADADKDAAPARRCRRGRGHAGRGIE